MRLLNHTLIYLSGILLLIIGTWAVIFYFSMLDEIYDSIDDGLDNYKVLIIQKAQNDSSVLGKSVFDESNYSVRRLTDAEGAIHHETYADTLMYMQNEQKMEPVRLLTTAFSQGGKFYELKVIASMVEEDDLIKDLLYYILILYFIIITSVVVINNFVLRKVWRPFYDLLDRLRRFNLKKGMAFSPPDTQVLEFRALNDTILQLLHKNMEVYESQKQFIENAAHELQTPLAISINKLELMAEEQALNEGQAYILSEVISNLERLTRLNSSLLLLSKIENRQFQEETSVELNNIVKKQLSDFAELIAFKELTVKVNEAGVFQHLFNSDIAVILVTNLLKNAITHNLPGGTLNIDIGEPFLVITNTGQQEALAPEKIFRRFYKTPGKSSSTGLGLAIVKTICDNYGLRIEYAYDSGHSFRISK